MFRLTVPARLLAAGAILVLAGSCPAGLIINPGFEDGNFAGWTISGPRCVIVSGGASQGTYYASQDANDGSSAEIKQTFTMPSDAASLSVDLVWLGTGGPFAHSATIMRVGDPNSEIDFRDGTKTDLTGLWDRYRLDISQFQNEQVEVKFRVTTGSGSTMAQWMDNVSVSNVVPEPACLALLCLGGPFLLRRKGR